MTNTMRRLGLPALMLLLGLAGTGLAQAQDVVYYHTDALGTPVVMTDSSGNVITGSRREFEPYGRQLSPTPVADGPGYTGHVSDAATGLDYMQQRYYDPVIGRFLSVDPVAAKSANGSNFNRYKYANNNPYKFVDPDGRYSCDTKADCAAAAAGLKAINAALRSSSLSTKAHAALIDARAFYGAQGVANGVHVRAVNSGDSMTETTKDSAEPNGLKTVVSLNTSNMSGIASKAQSMGQERVDLSALLGATMVHESVHGLTQQGIRGMIETRTGLKADEVKAYTAEARFDQAFGINPWSFLNARGGIDAAVVDKWAEISTSRACESANCL